MKLTPVLLVASIEKSLPFWIDRMGWTKTVEVPDGDRLGFAILVNGGAELMIQTEASASQDMTALFGDSESHRTALFIEVPDFADTLARLNGYPIALSERQTFYGMREVGVFEPNGHVVIFASPV